MDIVEKLRKQATKTECWSVKNPEGASLIWFDHDNSATPEREAVEWLKIHRQKGYDWDCDLEVVHDVYYSGADELLIEAADEIERLRTQSGG